VHTTPRDALSSSRVFLFPPFVPHPLLRGPQTPLANVGWRLSSGGKSISLSAPSGVGLCWRVTRLLARRCPRMQSDRSTACDSRLGRLFESDPCSGSPHKLVARGVAGFSLGFAVACGPAWAWRDWPLIGRTTTQRRALTAIAQLLAPNRHDAVGFSLWHYQPQLLVRFGRPAVWQSG